MAGALTMILLTQTREGVWEVEFGNLYEPEHGSARKI